MDWAASEVQGMRQFGPSIPSMHWLHRTPVMPGKHSSVVLQSIEPELSDESELSDALVAGTHHEPRQRLYLHAYTSNSGTAEGTSVTLLSDMMPLLGLQNPSLRNTRPFMQSTLPGLKTVALLQSMHVSSSPALYIDAFAKPSAQEQSERATLLPRAVVDLPAGQRMHRA
jgi:hypothetical protein